MGYRRVKRFIDVDIGRRIEVLWIYERIGIGIN